MILQHVSSISPPLKKKKIDIRYHTITKALQCPNINTSHNAHTRISRLSHVGRDGGKRIDWLIGGKRQAKRKEALLLCSRRCHITFGPRRHDGEGQTAPPLVPSWNRYVNRLSEKSTPKKRREGTWESRRKKKKEEREEDPERCVKASTTLVIGGFRPPSGGSVKTERYLIPSIGNGNSLRLFSFLNFRCKIYLSWKR